MMSRGAVGLIGVVGVAALWAGAAAWKTGSIERQIAQNAVAEVKKRGLDRRFESLVLDVSGREIFFSGVALTEYDRRALAEAAAATPGVAAVTAEIAIAPLADPFVFRVERRADGTAMLSGSVPGPEAQEKLVEAARALLGRDTRVSLRMARGVPEGDWYRAAKAAVEMMAMVQQGDAVLTGRTLTVSGRAADDAGLDAANAAFARVLPAGFNGSADIFTALDADLRGGPISALDACQALIDRVKAAEAVSFAPATAALRDGKLRQLDRLALAARRCEAPYLQIFAASDPKSGDPAANMRLGEARAKALAEALAQRGVPRARLAPLGRIKDASGVGADGPDVEFRVNAAALPVAKPFVWRAERAADGAVTMTGNTPSPEAASAVESRARALFAGSVSNASRAALGAPPGEWATAAGLALEAVAALQSATAVLSDIELSIRGVAKDDETLRAVQAKIGDGMPAGFRVVFGLTTVLDESLRGPALGAADECQTLVESVARVEPIEFVFDGLTLYGRHRQLFERLAAAMARCPNFALEVGGHTSGGGDPDAARALAERWAQATAEALMRAGTDRVRLRAVGHGNARPVADVNTEAGRQRNRRIVFRIVS